MISLRKIACVEDDTDIRVIASLALSDLGGFEVALYPGGHAALAQIEDFGPQLIILDVMMPEMDGVEVYHKLRAIPAFKHTPIIFMTAKAQMNELEEYLALGAAGVITKPFDPINLCTQVSDLWDRAVPAEKQSA